MWDWPLLTALSWICIFGMTYFPHQDELNVLFSNNGTSGEGPVEIKANPSYYSFEREEE